MAESDERVVRLQVAGTKPEDAGKGVARLSQTAFETLGIQEGEIVAIQGKRLTAALGLKPYPEDMGVEVIRLDGLQRANADVTMGDQVEVRKADVRPARRITIAPGQKNVRLSGSPELLRRTLFRRPLVAGDHISTAVYQRTMAPSAASRYPDDIFKTFLQQPAFALQEIRLIVVQTTPRGIVQVAEDTEIELLPEYTEPEEVRRTDVTYDDIGGLGDSITQVREMVELPLKHPELFNRLGIDPPKGVLLHGPPGTGKTLLARAVANESDAEFFSIAGPEIMGRHYGESEERLREVFQQAQEKAPSIVFIDEIDSIAPKRSETTGEVERRVVAQLLTLMDGLEPRQNVVVIAATNRLDAIDEALRRPGRFDREIVVGVPDVGGRRETLEIHVRGMPLAEDVDLDELARITYGFVGADLAALAREAAIDALRRVLPEIDLSAEGIPAEVLDRLAVTRADFVNALKRIQPSALREIMIQVPDVSWDDIGGLHEVKQTLREGIELPLKHPESFRRLGIRPPKGFLLFGPPGTGKTLLAKAVAREAEANFTATQSSDLLSKWYGESEQQISRMFARARQVAPCVVFIDEIDSLVPARGSEGSEPQVTARVVNTILAEMDGMEELNSIVVIGATNRPGLVDPALLRPGRFDELVYVGAPDEGGRLHILGIHTRQMPLADDVDLKALAAQTDRYTGADLEDVTRRAGLIAIRKRGTEAQNVTAQDFAEALEDSRPTVTEQMEAEYQRMRGELKRRAMEVRPIGFIHEGMVESTRERKHDD